MPAAPVGLAPTPGDTCGLRGCDAIRTYPNMAIMHWNKSTDSTVTAYAIYRDGVKIATKEKVATSYQDVAFADETVDLGMTYEYSVTAINPAGESVASNVLSVTMPEADTQAPNIPTSVTPKLHSTKKAIVVTAQGGADIGSSGFSKYNIYRDGVYVGSIFKRFRAKPILFEDEQIQANTTYSYTASSVDKAGNESDQSPPTSITTGQF